MFCFIYIAYWIAQKAIKYVIDHSDNFLLDEFEGVDKSVIEKETNELKELIFEYFSVWELYK